MQYLDVKINYDLCLPGRGSRHAVLPGADHADHGGQQGPGDDHLAGGVRPHLPAHQRHGAHPRHALRAGAGRHGATPPGRQVSAQKPRKGRADVELDGKEERVHKKIRPVCFIKRNIKKQIVKIL